MRKRIRIKDLEPYIYDALNGLEKKLNESSIDHTLRELIKIRASQINGCAYCIAIHTRTALKAGESTGRLFAISAWHESALFTDKEKVALKMTEEITHISKEGLTETTYQKAKEHFDDHQIAHLIIQIIQINSWNRIAVSTHMIDKEFIDQITTHEKS